MRSLVPIKFISFCRKINMLTFNCVLYKSNNLHRDCTENFDVSWLKTVLPLHIDYLPSHSIQLWGLMWRFLLPSDALNIQSERNVNVLLLIGILLPVFTPPNCNAGFEFITVVSTKQNSAFCPLHADFFDLKTEAIRSSEYRLTFIRLHGILS
jgi:hypothetical protein